MSAGLEARRDPVDGASQVGELGGQVARLTDGGVGTIEPGGDERAHEARRRYAPGGRGLLAATRSVLPKLPDSLGAKAWRALRNWLAGKERKLGARVNEYVHWSVRDRLRYQNTWVDGLGACKYEPRNVKGIDKYADPTELEAGLVDPARPGRKDEKRCAFHEAGLPCECEQYWQRVAATQTQPPMAA